MPFSRRPTSRLPIESQSLTIWPWNNHDLGMTLPLVWPWPYLWPWPQTSQTKLKLMSRFQNWHFPRDDLDSMTFILKWPRYCQDVPPHQKWSFYVNCFKSYSPNRHTHTVYALRIKHHLPVQASDNKINFARTKNDLPGLCNNYVTWKWLSAVTVVL